MNQNPNRGDGAGCLITIAIILLLSFTWVGRFVFGVLTFGTSILFFAIILAILSTILAVVKTAKRNSENKSDYNSDSTNAYGDSRYTGSFDSSPIDDEYDESSAIDVEDVEVHKNED